MNIGVLGWWSNGNQGDFAILESLKRALAPHRVVAIDLPFAINRDKVERLNLLDFLILGGGGLFQEAPPPPFDTFDLWGRSLRTPLGVAGVGFDAVEAKWRKAVEALVDQARFFYVRDEASREIVGHAKVQVAPDLSFLYPLFEGAVAPLPPRNPPLCGVNLRAVPGLDLGRWLEALRALPARLRGIPLSTYATWQEAAILRQLDENCAPTFTPALYDGLDLMVGTAFHSIVFAIQAGVPVLAIAYAPKVRRFMAEVGLVHYTLEPDGWDQLSLLYARLVAERESVAEHLRQTSAALTRAAREAFAAIKEEIETSARPRRWAGPRVSIVVVGSRSEAANRLTLASCLSQTHENLEIVLTMNGDRAATEAASPLPDRVKIVPVRADESVAEQLNRAFAQATGEYLSWTVAGNAYTHDAIACLLHRLQQDPACDAVYADYYTVREDGCILNVHRVESAAKLFRRNVIGPCFLYRSRLQEKVGPYRAQAPSVAYDYWLRAHRAGRLQPVHARLLYAQASQDAAQKQAQEERRTRHLWRSSAPAPTRALWHILDNDRTERWVIRPLLALLHKAQSAYQRIRLGRGRGSFYEN